MNPSAANPQDTLSAMGTTMPGQNQPCQLATFLITQSNFHYVEGLSYYMRHCEGFGPTSVVTGMGIAAGNFGLCCGTRQLTCRPFPRLGGRTPEVVVRAMQIVELTGPASMRLGTVADPVRGDGQILIDVHAAGVAFPDLLLTRGLYQLRPDPPFIPGSEVAGEVIEVGPGSRFEVGDRVAALCLLNGFAEQVSVPEDVVVALPPKMSFESGAALPMNYLTVEFALTTRGRLAEGESVLVHGAAGGVGTAAIQFAKLTGNRVIAVVSSARKGEVARRSGAHEVVLADGFLAAVKDLTGGRGVDIVVDPVGGDRFTDSLRSLAPFGRLLVLGFTAGQIPTVKVNRLLLSNTEVVGVSWGSYALANPPSIRAQWDRMAEALADGRLDPPLGAQYPLESAATALLELEARRATGKTILQVRP